MRADGRQLTNLTQNPAFDGAPDWQPLGDRHHHGGHCHRASVSRISRATSCG